MKKIQMKLKDFMKSEKVNSFNKSLEKRIHALIFTAIGSILFFVWAFIYPPFQGDVIDIKYVYGGSRPALDVPFQYNENVKELYTYKEYLDILVSGKGAIEKGFLIYGVSSNEISSGDVYSLDLKKAGKKQYWLGRNINIQTNNPKEYRRIYLVLIDKKTKAKNIYCIALKMESMKYSDSLVFNTDVTAYSNGTDNLSLVYEVKSKEDIQDVINNMHGSYIAGNKQDILKDFEIIENINFN